MEKYNINISLDRTWSIEAIKNIDKKIKKDKTDIETFGQFEVVKGEINWLLDSDIDDDMIKEVCEDELFLKEALFFPYIYKDKKWNKQDSFKGSFIDALNYVKKVFKSGK